MITVQPLSGGTGANLGTGTSAPQPITVSLTLTNPANFATSFSASDFIPVFQANSSLDQVEIFNLLLVPGVSDNLVLSAALSFAERKQAFAILDPPEQATAFGSVSVDKQMARIPASQNGAMYFPYLLSTDPVTTNPISIPPSGYVAGIYAATDTNRGVWKAPAGIASPLLDTVGPVANGVMNDMQQEC